MEKKGRKKLPFSQIDQVGVVVRDIDAAVEYYSSFGIGPFEPINVARFDREVYGKRVDENFKNIVRVAQMGRVQFELVQPVSGESVQKDFLENRGEGVNHLGFFVDDLDREVSELVGRGFKVINSVKYVGGGGIAYFNTDKIGGVMFELIQWPYMKGK
jgi:catechol 2,3-dioxygenase-like lactoylglutathione lyase family enzyme